MIGWFYSLSRFCIIIFLKIFFRLQQEGKENIPDNGGFILASNHVSLLDPLILGVISNRRLNYMAKEELFRNFLLSFWLHRVGAFPVKRKAHDVRAIREALKRLKSSKPLLMFPEGGRSPNGEILDAQPGAAMLAAHTGVPVLPAFIKGSREALAKGSRFLRRTKIIVYFGKPFQINKNKTYQEATERIKSEIVSLGVNTK
ncbi:MAG: 1-acyl-sn-glycerol-3-phosphate acyltransferase [Candidatus Omnitrophica bacterium]|nr:1-acyl-sn-glycerol-3-phosphate acyltransferase [Candidatus Omnitrophota bacterium]